MKKPNFLHWTWHFWRKNAVTIIIQRESYEREKKILTQSDVTFNFLWQPTIMPADKMLLYTVYILGQ